MLALTRKVGESIRIGENIYIKVVSIKGDRVKLGFSAPEEIKILRTELLEKEVQDVREQSQ